MPRTILIAEADRYAPEALAIYESLGRVVRGAGDRAGLPAAAAEADVLVVRLAHRLDAALFDHAPRVRIIVSPTTGLDHVDTAAAARRGIAVLSLRGETAFLRAVPATAEHTWALLLALVRRIPWAFDDVRAGGWNRDAFRGRDLCGRRLGIVGLGRVGSRVARYGAAFGMRVAAYSTGADEWPDFVARRATLAELLAESDVLTLHVPLAPDTVGLIGRAELARLPAGAVLVNTARGAILDEAALIEALDAGRPAGAALDVLADETAPGGAAGGALAAYAARSDRLLLTPHLGGATVESMALTEVFMARKLERFLARDPHVASTPASGA